MIPLQEARWRLAIIWFACCVILFLILVLQSIGGAFGDDTQRLWGWALPNFLPTISLMVSVFAANALRPQEANELVVRRDFYFLSIGLSVFYLFLLLLAVLSQPLLPILIDSQPSDKIETLEASNLWLGPVQGLVVIALGVLFFLEEERKDD